ncbi:phospholipid/cholesterol/gamma-HCH transport system permease protein [Roseinatronobacter bogoriensis subsp. barguzinensis]|nr:MULTISPECIES: MlaE family lipid ABC transporter permease subunit [Rhodobaca]MBB4208017.1 phospholipid/cholesterol/gamma-HCH transport system permease protein [Rhodobaca bogoriensis DSM 18756]TDW38656.1 phospholipid/cholesterol/gamma-HCH transport system permease protein [Rhodobaca barguzinensis]TDY69305.1 phospholipid/cholesterol/gamma-HCH transport system permease protein [Rhodobaca bogoriensis DSM 18756]
MSLPATPDTALRDDRAAAKVRVTRDGQGWVLSGSVTVRNLSDAASALRQIEGSGDIELDLSQLESLDTAGAYALQKQRQKLAAVGAALQFVNLRADHQALIDRVEAAMPKPESVPAARLSVIDLLEKLGRTVTGAGRFLIDLVAMLGLFLARLGYLLRHPSEFRVTALVHHCDQVGWKAVPIVALMGFLIGVVLAFQGSVQLRQFGAEIFVVDLIAISILRELGILLTAIIVAGRTASSFTAAIGSMKMREEIDAMRTLAIDPATALFVPRILALLITLPILGAIANVMGLFGGAMMAWIELGISPGMFLTRLLEDTSVDHVLVGFVKAPVFAMIIGVIGCHAGMQVGGNAESLGAQTSAAVVRAIFMVIVADALFSVFFAIMGI